MLNALLLSASGDADAGADLCVGVVVVVVVVVVGVTNNLSKKTETTCETVNTEFRNDNEPHMRTRHNFEKKNFLC